MHNPMPIDIRNGRYRMRVSPVIVQFALQHHVKGCRPRTWPRRNSGTSMSIISYQPML
jgi:hypothetical protein